MKMDCDETKFEVFSETGLEEIIELLVKAMTDVLPLENRMYVGDRIEITVKYRPEDK